MTMPMRIAAALADHDRLEQEIGAGGMATVYRAEDLRHDRRVAVKLLRPELAAVIGAERFLAEIKLTRTGSTRTSLPSSTPARPTPSSST
jgi:serine/threonine protein kinase